MCFGSPRGSAAAQESRGRCESNVEPLAAATSCRGRAVCKFGSLIASSAAGFERFWRRPSRRVPLRREVSVMPGESWHAGRRAPGPCGLCFGAAADVRTVSTAKRRRAFVVAPSRSSHASAGSRLLGLEARDGSRGSLRASPTPGQDTPSPRAWTRDDDQGPAAAQACPHHNMHNSLPRRPRQRRSVFRARRLCGTRFQGN